MYCPLRYQSLLVVVMQQPTVRVRPKRISLVSYRRPRLCREGIHGLRTFLSLCLR